MDRKEILNVLYDIDGQLDKLQETDLFQDNDELMRELGEVIGCLNNTIDMLED